jgi:hypothetical protein
VHGSEHNNTVTKLFVTAYVFHNGNKLLNIKAFQGLAQRIKRTCAAIRRQQPNFSKGKKAPFCETETQAARVWVLPSIVPGRPADI